MFAGAIIVPRRGLYAAGKSPANSTAAHRRLRLAAVGRGAFVPYTMRDYQDVDVVAFADVATNKLKVFQEDLAKNNLDAGRLKFYQDWRVMLDEMGGDIDALQVATPDHNHAVISMAGLKRGKHVYCEKPLTHNISEARVLADTAGQTGLATQMGNQGYASAGIRQLAAYIQAGAIGLVREVHCWNPQIYRQPNVSEPKPVPPGFDWDVWLGPRDDTEYRSWDSKWYSLIPFGTGVLGGMGVHVLSALWKVFGPMDPATIELLEIEEFKPDEKPFGKWPLKATVCWQFPATATRPALKVFWYEGAAERPNPDDVKTWKLHRPQLADELEKEYGDKMAEAGSIFVGEKGYMHSPAHSNHWRFIPYEKVNEVPKPAAVEPSPGGIMADFLAACRGERAACSNFTVSGPLVEAMFTGHLAMRAGVGQKVEWDGPAMKVKNLPHLNEFVTERYRKGFQLV